MHPSESTIPSESRFCPLCYLKIQKYAAQQAAFSNAANGNVENAFWQELIG
jgi:hypothetical protein